MPFSSKYSLKLAIIIIINGNIEMNFQVQIFMKDGLSVLSTKKEKWGTGYCKTLCSGGGR